MARTIEIEITKCCADDGCPDGGCQDCGFVNVDHVPHVGEEFYIFCLRRKRGGGRQSVLVKAMDVQEGDFFKRVSVCCEGKLSYDPIENAYNTRVCPGGILSRTEKRS